jgi:hypothetical protein
MSGGKANVPLTIRVATGAPGSAATCFPKPRSLVPECARAEDPRLRNTRQHQRPTQNQQFSFWMSLRAQRSNLPPYLGLLRAKNALAATY